MVLRPRRLLQTLKRAISMKQEEQKTNYSASWRKNEKERELFRKSAREGEEGECKGRGTCNKDRV